MKEKLAVIYDTANIIGCISRAKIEGKHVLCPLLISPAPLAVAVLPIVERDVAPISGWNEVLEGIRSIAENKVKSLDLYKREEEFLCYGRFDRVKFALKKIEIIYDARRIATLQPRGDYSCYIFIDESPEIRQDEEIEEDLLRLVERTEECKGASPREAVEDVQTYLLPYLDLLREGRFAVLLVTDDACFRGLVSAYSTWRRLDVVVMEARLLANVTRLARRLSEALRSSSSDSR